MVSTPFPLLRERSVTTTTRLVSLFAALTHEQATTVVAVTIRHLVVVCVVCLHCRHELYLLFYLPCCSPDHQPGQNHSDCIVDFDSAYCRASFSAIGGGSGCQRPCALARLGSRTVLSHCTVRGCLVRLVWLCCCANGKGSIESGWDFQ